MAMPARSAKVSSSSCSVSRRGLTLAVKPTTMSAMARDPWKTGTLTQRPSLSGVGSPASRLRRSWTWVTCSLVAGGRARWALLRSRPPCSCLSSAFQSMKSAEAGGWVSSWPISEGIWTWSSKASALSSERPLSAASWQVCSNSRSRFSSTVTWESAAWARSSSSCRALSALRARSPTKPTKIPVTATKPVRRARSVRSRPAGQTPLSRSV